MAEPIGSSAAPGGRRTRLRALRRRLGRPFHPDAPDPHVDDRALLSLIVETQREISAAGSDIENVMRLVLTRSQELTGADGAMVSLVDGES